MVRFFSLWFFFPHFITCISLEQRKKRNERIFTKSILLGICLLSWIQFYYLLLFFAITPLCPSSEMRSECHNVFLKRKNVSIPVFWFLLLACSLTPSWIFYRTWLFVFCLWWHVQQTVHRVRALLFPRGEFL